MITKEIDKSSPLLYNVLVNNENITDMEARVLDAHQRDGDGDEVQYYTIELMNANIVPDRTVHAE